MTGFPSRYLIVGVAAPQAGAATLRVIFRNPRQAQPQPPRNRRPRTEIDPLGGY
ncbi:hypothetical protein HMPREF9621_01868 [Cutibacterium modestum HL037PA2]|uniref:Uncharacterized protein n=1 Tax=Cutibacterium modestum HL044PA1 TaxID=765109 RepID=A0ABP2KAW7_9ACTN|nr:hypothetical protein HMPREF9621_01868 [Cutibacterium modestum HL037PA2]EFS93427.1 hypothetical protein HMPREF9607_00347 [Cutibacterium modestum HL044PA1]